MMKWKEIRPSYESRIAELEKLDPYTLLGVSEDAPDEEIKAAHRNKVKAYHPDVSDPFLKQHNEEVLKLVNRAYERIMRGTGQRA
jgi:DnaJ-class molecular chaperone